MKEDYFVIGFIQPLRSYEAKLMGTGFFWTLRAYTGVDLLTILESCRLRYQGFCWGWYELLNSNKSLTSTTICRGGGKAAHRNLTKCRDIVKGARRKALRPMWKCNFIFRFLKVKSEHDVIYCSLQIKKKLKKKEGNFCVEYGWPWKTMSLIRKF
jgi:hypothetical protein